MADVSAYCTYDPANRSALSTAGTGKTLHVSYADQTVDLHYNVYTRAQFNSPYNVSDSITSCANLFRGCTKLNQPVTLGTYVKNCDNMFTGCQNFNQTFDFSYSHINNFCNMFRGCNNLNLAIQRFRFIQSPSEPIDYSGMFFGCTNLKLEPYMEIRGYDLNCYAMFMGCYNLNSNIELVLSGGQTTNIAYMFSGCNSLASNINIKGASSLSGYTGFYIPASLPEGKNIYFHVSPELEHYFVNDGGIQTNTWGYWSELPDHNGYQYFEAGIPGGLGNIYVYNDYH